MTLRTDRVSSLIKEEVGNLFTREYRDSGYGFMTVTEVHVSPDLRLAKIYVSIFGNPEVKQKTMDMLEKEKAHIRSHIGSHLRLKFTPAISFFIDETMDKVDNIARLLKKIHDEESPNHS